MSSQELVGDVSVQVENVGGIEATEIDLSPGVTVLSGRNATNRTSFLRAIMGALGSHDVSLKAGAESGRIELDLAGERYVRTVSRGANGPQLGGEPYLEEPTLADRFAFLLRTNPARQAIVQRADLREIIMDPVDTEAIRNEITRLEERRRELDRELESLDGLEPRLPTLEQRKAELETELEAKEADLAETEASIDAVEADEAGGDAPPLEDLRTAREELQAVRGRIEAEHESLEALREDREEVEAALEELGADPLADPGDLDSKIEAHRARKRTLESTVSRLQQIHQFNAQVLETGDHPFEAPADGLPTDQLVAMEDELVCWTCGNQAERDAFEATQARLRDLIDDHREEKAAVEDQLSGLLERRKSLENERERRERLEDRLADIESEIEARESRVADLEAERDDLAATVDSLETTVADTGQRGYDELVALHREASDLEYEITRLQDELADVEEELRSVQADLERRSTLESEWESVQSDLLAQRERIERIETAAVEAFNEEMATVLDRLEYDNIARIWLERRVPDGADAARFELNVARETDGVTHEDTIDHLSESEREVTGLVFGLAGYLVHDVHETVPFILLDSLEAIDADRIARLVEYFADYARYLVVALLPEDAAALDDAYDRISEV